MNTILDGSDDRGDQEPPSDDLVAAEYVLGVLDAGPRLAAESRILTDRAFADRVASWQRRFAPLILELRPVDVPGRVWTRIRERLGWPLDEPSVTRAARGVAFWRLATGVAAAVALGLLAVDFVPRWISTRVSEAQLAKAVTTLSRDDGSAGWLATVDARRGTLLMVPVPSAPDAQGRAAELWLIPSGQAPRSLGRVSFDRAETVAVPATSRADLTSNSVLAITLEPAAGIPHVAPTGPIVAKGAIHL
jgi:anti-sigma-K factor RskA